MDASQVINALLKASPDVAALVGTNIYALIAAQGIAPPYLVYKEVDAVLQPVIDCKPPQLWQARIQVTAVGADYPTVKAILVAASKACNYQRGLIAGVTVSSIVKETAGSDVFDVGLQSFEQSFDLMVLYFDTGS